MDDSFVVANLIMPMDEMSSRILAGRCVDAGRKSLEDDITVNERLVGRPLVLLAIVHLRKAHP
jgi:hypothetical protein